MTTTEARDKVKVKYSIPSATTSLDASIDACVTTAIDWLASYVSVPGTADTTQSLASSVNTLTYASEVYKIFYRYSTTSDWLLTTAWQQVGGIIYFYENFGGAVSLKILPRSYYTTATIATIPVSLTVPLIDMACAELATVFAGNKSKYNIYSQTNGARGVDNMLSLSEFYRNSARERIEPLQDFDGLL